MKKILKSTKSWLHGFYIAAGTTIGTAIIPILQNTPIEISSNQIIKILISGGTAGLVYIIKNIFVGSSQQK